MKTSEESATSSPPVEATPAATRRQAHIASQEPPGSGERSRDGSRYRIFYRFCQFWCQLVFLLFFRGRAFHVKRVPRRGGVLLASNHQSFLDPVLAGLALRRECAFMGRDSLFEKQWLVWIITALNCFPIKRGTADMRAIKEALRRLRAGYALVAFPEGTRTPDGSVQPFLPGVILIARKANVPIIPVAIIGAFEAWPRHAKLPAPRRITVAYGEPISPASLAGLSDEACVELVRERLVALKEKYQSQHP